MYIVSVLLKNSPSVMNYSFKHYKNADELFRKVSSAEGRIEIEDDYGAKGNLDITGASVNLTDISKDMDRNGEQQIIQQKSSLKTQKLAAGDIGLQMLSRSNGVIQQ